MAGSDLYVDLRDSKFSNAHNAFVITSRATESFSSENGMECNSDEFEIGRAHV